jgi:hypothetical protein
VKVGYKGLTEGNLEGVVNETWGFSGREIEKVVKFAIERAFFEEKPVSAKYLLEAAKGIVPTSETKADDIRALREWAVGKAIVAGSPLEERPRMAETSKARTVEA